MMVPALTWMLWVSAGASPVQGHFVYQPFVDTVAAGEAHSWHPNRVIPEVHLSEATATIDVDGARSCTFTIVEEDAGQVLHLSCEGRNLTATLQGDTLVLPLWGDEPGTLVRTSWTVAEWYAARRLEQTLSLVPRVQGRWVRGDASLDITAATARSQADTWSLVPCRDGGLDTVCLRASTDWNQAFTLRDGQLEPVQIVPDHDRWERWSVQQEAPGSSWVPDRPCTVGICGLDRPGPDGTTLQWTPRNERTVDQVADGVPLLGGVLAVRTAPDIDRVQVRLRGHRRGAVSLDGAPVGWGDLGITSAWVPLTEGPGGWALPDKITLPPAPLTPEERAARTLATLVEPFADDRFRSRAAEAAVGCPDASTAPCRTGLGAVELEVTAWRGEDPVQQTVLVLEEGFGASWIASTHGRVTP